MALQVGELFSSFKIDMTPFWKSIAQIQKAGDKLGDNFNIDTSGIVSDMKKVERAAEEMGQELAQEAADAGADMSRHIESAVRDVLRDLERIESGAEGMRQEFDHSGEEAERSLEEIADEAKRVFAQIVAEAERGGEAVRNLADGADEPEREFKQLEAIIREIEKLLRELGHDINIDIDGAIADMEKLRNESKEADNATDEAGNSADQAGGRFQWLGQAGAAAFAAVVAGAAAATAGIGLMNLEFEKSIDMIAATTTATESEMRDLEQAIKSVYQDAYGESLGHVASAAGDLRRILGDMWDDNEKVISGALMIQEAYQVEVKETAKVVKSLRDNFDGVSETDALDIIAKGFQLGGDYADDLMDTLNEYAPQFAAIGMSANDFLTILISGAEAGAFNLDKVGDAVKEFTIEAEKNGTRVADGYKRIGLNGEEMAKKIAGGGEGARSAFIATVSALSALDDEVLKNTAGAELFGTQWEDVKKYVIEAMSEIQRGTIETSGAIEGLGNQAHDNTLSKFTEIWRTLTTMFVDQNSPLQIQLGKLADWLIAHLPQIQGGIVSAMGAVGDVFNWLVDTVVEPVRETWQAAMEATGTSSGEMATQVGDILTSLGDVIKTVILFIMVFWKAYGDEILQITIGLWNAVAGVLSGALKVISGIIKLLTGLVTGDFELMKAGVMKIVQGLVQAIGGILAGAWQVLSGACSILLQDIQRFFGSMGKLAQSWGFDIVAGLWNGISGAAGWLNNKIKAFCADVAGAITDFFDIHSPSRLMAEYGGYISQGLAVGIEKEGGKTVSKAERMAKAVGDAINKTLASNKLDVDLMVADTEYYLSTLGKSAKDNVNRLSAELELLDIKLAASGDSVAVLERAVNDMTKAKGANAEETRKLELQLRQEMTAQEKLKQQYRDTKDALADQSKELERFNDTAAEVAQTYRNELSKAAEDYREKEIEENRKLVDNIRRENERYDNALKDRAKSLRNFVGLFDAVTTKEVSGDTLLANLQGQVTAFEGWQQSMASLGGRKGMDAGLLTELKEMGPRAGAEIAALNSLTDEQLGEYVKLWRQKNKAATDEAAKQLVGLRREVDDNIARMTQESAARLEEYKNQWFMKQVEIRNNTLAQMQTMVEDAGVKGEEFMTTLGQNIADGMPGLMSELETVKKNVKGVVDEILSLVSRVTNPVTGGKDTAAFQSLKTLEIPGLATGGTVIGSGLTLVGERGPEILNLPTGSKVIPLDRDFGGGGGGAVSFTVQNIIQGPIYGVDDLDKAMTGFIKKKAVPIIEQATRQRDRAAGKTI